MLPQMFGNDWQPGTATIVAKKTKGGSSSGQSAIGFAFVADVVTDDGATFRTELKPSIAMLAAHGSGVARLSEYDTVKVLVDVKHEKAKFDSSDPQISEKSDGASDAFDAALEQPPGSPPPGAGAADGGRVVAPE